MKIKEDYPFIMGNETSKFIGGLHFYKYILKCKLQNLYTEELSDKKETKVYITQAIFT